MLAENFVERVQISPMNMFLHLPNRSQGPTLFHHRSQPPLPIRNHRLPLAHAQQHPLETISARARRGHVATQTCHIQFEGRGRREAEDSTSQSIHSVHMW